MKVPNILYHIERNGLFYGYIEHNTKDSLDYTLTWVEFDCNEKISTTCSWYNVKDALALAEAGDKIRVSVDGKLID